MDWQVIQLVIFFLRVVGCYKTPIISTDKQMVWCPFIKKSQFNYTHVCQ